MLSLWNLYLLLLLWLLSFHVTVLTGEKEKQQPDTDTLAHHLTQRSQKLHGSDFLQGNTMFVSENIDPLNLPINWLSSSSSDDAQGVLGEYTDIQESSETLHLFHNEKGVTTHKPTESAIGNAASEERTQPKESSSGGASPHSSQEPTLESPESSTLNTDGYTLHPLQSAEDQRSFPAKQSETPDRHLPLLPSGLFPLDRPNQDTTSLLLTGPGPGPEHNTPPVAPGGWGGTTGLSVTTQGKIQERTLLRKEIGHGLHNVTDDVLKSGAVMETGKDDVVDDGQHVPKASVTLLDGNTSVTPCKTSNHTWNPIYPDDFTPNEPLHPSLALSPALFVPLYSDWNSALATWGFAWEVHIYGLGSVFTIFGLISVVCMLGLPLRCPPGSPYFTLLYLFLLAFAGTQAFCLLYDAYSYQDRLPPMGSLLLSQLPFPCLTTAFSLAFILLSLRSRKHLSLPLALPKPCLLLCVSLLHFGVSLGCVGILQLVHSLPVMILLLPQGVFVCLSVFLSCSFIISYCLIQVNTKHIYRLNDNEESGGSPDLMKHGMYPFAKLEDWGRAAGAGVGASLCLLGCGGLQLYGILHALGLGGVDGYGFMPWPWWGYQIGCRLCEAGVCLGLSLIGAHPLFCQNNSINTITHPRPGSWSRLSCSSPSRGLTMPSQDGVNSPVLSSHESWSQGKQERLVVCDVIVKGHSEALPLCSVVELPGNGLECVPKDSLPRAASQTTFANAQQEHKNAAESQLSTLNNLGLETDSTVDLRPPSPIDLSRSIDQALFSESLFTHSIFGLPRLVHASSSLSLSSPSQGSSKQKPSSVENALYRTSSCGDMDQENKTLTSSRPSQLHCSLKCRNKPPMSPEHLDWKGSDSGSTLGLCSEPKETAKLRSHSWANRGQNFAQTSLPRAIPHLSYHRRYRTLSLASQESQGSSRLAGTKHLSESKQLEWDLAVQAEFVNVCKQIDALSVCSDTIEL